jgi:hypothetical protein
VRNRSPASTRIASWPPRTKLTPAAPSSTRKPIQICGGMPAPSTQRSGLPYRLCAHADRRDHEFGSNKIENSGSLSSFHFNLVSFSPPHHLPVWFSTSCIHLRRGREVEGQTVQSDQAGRGRAFRRSCVDAYRRRPRMAWAAPACATAPTLGSLGSSTTHQSALPPHRSQSRAPAYSREDSKAGDSLAHSEAAPPPARRGHEGMTAREFTGPERDRFFQSVAAVRTGEQANEPGRRAPPTPGHICALALMVRVEIARASERDVTSGLAEEQPESEAWHANQSARCNPQRIADMLELSGGTSLKR